MTPLPAIDETSQATAAGQGLSSALCCAPKFDRTWRAACAIRPCSVTEVDGFIRAHYLGKRPAIVLLCLMMLHEGNPVGCIIYSAPPREADKRYGGKTWELARLYLLDEIPRNAETWLIGQSIRYIRRHNKDVAHLLSYADPSAGHRGTIYKAANWRQDGRTDDERKSPRCDYVDARTGKKYGRKGNMPADAEVVRVPRVSKWRFHYALISHNVEATQGCKPLSPLSCSAVFFHSLKF